MHQQADSLYGYCLSGILIIYALVGITYGSPFGLPPIRLVVVSLSATANIALDVDMCSLSLYTLLSPSLLISESSLIRLTARSTVAETSVSTSRTSCVLISDRTVKFLFQCTGN